MSWRASSTVSVRSWREPPYFFPISVASWRPHTASRCWQTTRTIGALAGRAQIIVTGDRALLRLGRHEGVSIISLREYLDRV